MILDKWDTLIEGLYRSEEAPNRSCCHLSLVEAPPPPPPFEVVDVVEEEKVPGL